MDPSDELEDDGSQEEEYTDSEEEEPQLKYQRLGNFICFLTGLILVRGNRHRDFKARRFSQVFDGE